MPDNQPLKTLPADAKVINNTPLKALPKDTQIIGTETPQRSSGLDYTNILGLQKDKNKIEDAVNWVQQGGRRDGESILDSEKDALRDVLENPRATQEQVKRAIQVIQGRDAKHSEGNYLYYFKREDNGVMMPVALAYGEKPPKGYDVASTWGSAREAKDDSWYTDLGKSIFNGMVSVGQGAVDLAQLGTTAVSGEESKYLNKLSNTAEALKFKKDQDIQRSIYNPQGVESWGDLVSKERFDFSPESLWGTLNMAGESLVGFLGGAGATSNLVKGIKGVETLSKGEAAASAFTGSFLQQLGDNMDAARDAGLKGRDIATFATLTTGVQASIDAAFGLESKIFRGSFKQAEKDLMKELGKTVEKDASGMITEEGFKQLAKNTTLQYGQMTNSWLKEFGKDAIIEGTQEAAQDAVAKSAENLWDKMTPNDRAKFGTDASSPQAFASYIQNGLTGLIAGTPLAAYSAAQKAKYDAKSKDAFRVVQEGPEAVNELKQNLKVAKDKKHLDQKEYDEAIFKIDTYDKYNQQTKDLNLDDKEKKEAFELSFNIEGLKSEINFKPEDLEKLDPIAIAKIDSKKELIKGLQKKLNEIILKEDVKKEVKVGPDTINKIVKQEEKKKEAPGEPELNALTGRYSDLVSKPVKTEKPARKALNEVSLEDWNDNNKTSSLERKQILQEHLKNTPNNEIDATLQEGENGTMIAVLPDGKKINLAQSAQSNTGNPQENMIRKNLPKTKEYGKVVDRGGNAIESEPGKPLYSYKEPVAIKRVEIKAYDKEGNPEYDKDGKQKKLAVLSVYNKENGGHIIFTRERDKMGFKYKQSEYTPKEIEQFEAIKKANHLNEDIKPFSRVSEPKTEKPVSKIDFDKAAGKAKTERELDRVIDEATKAEYPIDFDIVAKQREKIRTKPVKEKTPEDVAIESLEAQEAESRNPELTPQEIEEELAKESAREQAFAETGQFEKITIKDVVTHIASDHKKLLDEIQSLKGKPASEVLKYLKNNINDKSLYPVLDLMIDRSKNNKIDEFLLFNGLVVMPKKDKSTLANYVHNFGEKRSEINVNIENARQTVKRGLMEGILHEYLHAFTIGALSSDSTDINEFKFSFLMNAIFDEVKEKTSFKNEYGFTNVKEFVAELMSNPEFVKKIKGKKSIFQKIIDAIKALFGFNVSSNDSENERLVDEAIYAILSFIENVNPRATNHEALQKEVNKSKKFKDLEELSPAELARKTTKSFENYRTDVLGRNLEQIRKDLIDINKALESDKYSQDQKDALKSTKEAIKQQEKKDKSKWMAYKEDVAILSSAMSDGKLDDYPIEKLVELYNLMQANFQDAAKEARFKKVMEQIAYRMFQKRKEELKQYKGFVEEQANKQDLAPKDKLMKVLSHMTENFPELQEFSKMFDNSYLDMQNERYKLKTDLEKLGKAVIKEKNKQLGIKDKFDSFRFSNSAKYFDFIEHPEGRYYTVEEAQKKGFTDTQMKFLKFMLDLNELRRQQLAEMGTSELNDEILKVDKGVGEAYQTEGLLQAFSAYLGNGYNIRNVRIGYKGKPTSYGEIEQDLAAQAKKGAIDKAKALVQMLKYNFAARRQLKKGVNVDEKDNPLFVKENSEYQLSTDGRLKSKFNKTRDKDRSYSKDFYHAAFEFIDDYTHVKHMNPLLPYINSIEHLNKVGFGEHGAKNNVAEWVKQWKDLHIFKTDKPGALGPEVDAALRMLRKLSTLTVMAGNIPAGLWNIAMGTYNNLRAETAKEVAVGIKRLVRDGVLNKKASDILKKYQVVSIESDFNPKAYAGKLFRAIAHGLTSAGEYYIQGSMFLGLMSDKEYDSFEYKTDENGVRQLVVKPGVDEKALSEKLISYKNRVSDIQGKYAEKDRRNFMLGEFGKAVMQYKVWMPDAIKQRFGDRYIDRNGVEHIGSFRTFWGQGLADLREEARSKGWINTVANSNSAHAKAMRSNIKGLALVALFMSLRLANDDDEKKRRKADNIDKALGNLLFIFDPKSAKFMIENPVPAAGVLLNLVNAVEAAGTGDFVKSGKSIGKDIPYNKVATTVEDLLDD